MLEFVRQTQPSEMDKTSANFLDKRSAAGHRRDAIVECDGRNPDPLGADRAAALRPEIKMLIDGTDPFATAKPDARLIKLLAHSRLSLTWHEQRTVLGFA